jgi:diadenosine tetraphosphate (Ap4A) HIT family hydrolase
MLCHVPIDLPQHRDDRCPFCNNVMGGNQTAVVHQDEETYAFINPRMAGLGHTLVIPKRHAPTLLDLDAAEAQAIMRQVHRIADAIARVYDPSGLNVFQNNGLTAGQTVAHYHVHIVPSYPGDLPGRIFNTAELERTPIEEGLEVAARIAAALR